MKNLLLKIGETITAIAIIGLAIAIGVAGIMLCFKLIGYLLGAH